MNRAKRPSRPAESVFEILASEHAGMLEAYLRSLVGPNADLDDLFQETMIVAWRRLDEFDQSRSFGAWLRGIARVLVMERARKGAARARTTDPRVLEEIDRRFETLGRAPGDTFRERAERLVDCVARLPEGMREAIELVYMRGLTIVAAAGAIGQGEEAVKKRVQRGRALLAECMGIGGGS